MYAQYIYKVYAFESIRNNLCCQTRASPGHFKAARLINGSFRSATLHIPWEVAGLVVGVGLFIIFQIKMSLGAPLKLLTCFKCPLLMVCPGSNEFKGCLARNLGVPCRIVERCVSAELNLYSSPCLRCKNCCIWGEKRGSELAL